MCKILSLEISPNSKNICAHIVPFECIWNFFEIHGGIFNQYYIFMKTEKNEIITYKYQLTFLYNEVAPHEKSF